MFNFFMVAVLGILAVLGVVQVRLALRERHKRWLIIPGTVTASSSSGVIGGVGVVE